MFATEDIARGMFIVEYAGKLVSKKVAERLERRNPSCFRFFFKHRGATLWYVLYLPVCLPT